MEQRTIHSIDRPARHDPISPRQVAPRQHVEIEGQLDRRQLVRDLIARHNGATADDLARILKQQNIQVSSTLILQELSRAR